MSHHTLNASLNAPASSDDVAAAVAAAIQAAKASVKASSDGFYAKRDPKRALTRPNQLPEKQEDLLKRTLGELEELQWRAEAHVATAARELRAQVTIASRELLGLPAAALSALATHESAHVRVAAEADAAQHCKAAQGLEAQRAQHAAALSPALCHPARRAPLRELRDAEAARSAAAMGAAKHALEHVRKAVPERALLAERRLDAAARQLADLLTGVLLPHDLVPAPNGDDSLAALPPLSLEHLQRLEDDMTAMEASAAAPPAAAVDAGRPFRVAAVPLPLAALRLSELGWAPRHDALLAAVAAAAPVGTEAGTANAGEGVGPAEGRSAATLSVLLAPVQCALVRAFGAAAHKLEEHASADLERALGAVEKDVHAEQVWQTTWAATLDKMAPAAAPTKHCAV